MYETLLDRDLLPDWLIRLGIRRFLKQRLSEEDQGDPARNRERLMRFVGQLRESPVAIETQAANQQHYEVPAAFYEITLGKQRKYSCAYYPDGVTTLNEAEEKMLELTVERARIADGDSILELGCGWGSLTLNMAERFPNSRILGVSNSNSQREFITAEARRRGLTNIEIRTCDMNVFDTRGETFDRVVSVEMFEHMRNYRTLLCRIAHWMKPGATLFVHIFTHTRFAYPYEVRDESDWMAKYFFTGGIMPSEDLLLFFQDHLKIREQWSFNGRHYAQTSEHWLENQDANRDRILSLFREVYGPGEELRWFVRWRVFFMACAELWAYRDGREWTVSHYLFERPA